MENYETVMTNCQFTPENIYNLAETGIITVISRCGQKQVAQAASAERGQLVVIFSVINATGNSLSIVFSVSKVQVQGLFFEMLTSWLCYT